MKRPSARSALRPAARTLATLALVVAACRPGPGLEAPEGQPYVRGPIESVSHRATASGVLVGAGPGSREMCGIAATVDAETRYLRRVDGRVEAATIGDLHVGDTVAVYVDGPVAESCPLQGRASVMVLER